MRTLTIEPGGDSAAALWARQMMPLVQFLPAERRSRPVRACGALDNADAMGRGWRSTQ